MLLLFPLLRQTVGHTLVVSGCVRAGDRRLQYCLPASHWYQPLSLLSSLSSSSSSHSCKKAQTSVLFFMLAVVFFASWHASTVFCALLWKFTWHATIRQISNHYFCTIALCELCVCAIFYVFPAMFSKGIFYGRLCAWGKDTNFCHPVLNYEGKY